MNWASIRLRQSAAYAQLGLNVLAIATGEVLLKLGASANSAELVAAPLGLNALRSGTTWLGIALYILGLALWLNVLRSLSLSRAYAFSCLVYVAVPFGAWFVIGEAISAKRMLGIALILTGCLIFGSRAASLEERL